MLNSARRISKANFTKILQEGRGASSPFFSTKILPLEKIGLSRFAFVVSAKTAKSAVRRNFLKRRSRHAIKKNLPLIKEGYYCVIFIKKDLADLPFSAYEAEIIDSLKRSGLLI